MVKIALAVAYTAGVRSFIDKETSWSADNYSALLLDNTYTPNQDTHQFVSNLTGEASGGGYTRVALTGKSVTTASGVVKLLCDDIVFPSVTDTNILYLVVFRNTGVDSASKLLAYVQFTAVINPSSESVTFAVSATQGIVNLALA